MPGNKLSQSDEPYTTTARFVTAQRRSLVLILSIIVVVFVVTVGSMWYALVHALDTVHEFAHDNRCRSQAIAAELSAVSKISILGLTDPGNTEKIDAAIQMLLDADRVAEQVAAGGCA